MILLCLLNFPAPPITSPVSSIYDRNSCPYHCDGDREAAAINASLTWYSEPDPTPSPVGTPSYGPKDFEREVAEEEGVDAAVLASLEHGCLPEGSSQPSVCGDEDFSQQPGFCLDDDGCTQRPCVVVDDDDDDGVATQLLPGFDADATQWFDKDATQYPLQGM